MHILAVEKPEFATKLSELLHFRCQCMLPDGFRPIAPPITTAAIAKFVKKESNRVNLFIRGTSTRCLRWPSLKGSGTNMGTERPNKSERRTAPMAAPRLAAPAGAAAIAQVVDNRPATAMQMQLQAKADSCARMQQGAQLKTLVENRAPRQRHSLQGAENHTGLPDQLRSGVESMSGISMDDVKVNFNSPQPAQLNASAFAQGSEIHVGPGQEQHLPHEAWHVVQQKQGRVGATLQMAGVPVNDDQALESEADQMGARAAAGPNAQVAPRQDALAPVPVTGTPTLQGLFGMEKESRVSIRGARSGVIAKGSGFSVEPDNGNKGKILEFITDPFDEHTSKESVAIDAYTRQLDTIWAMMAEIKQLSNNDSIDEVFTRHGLEVKQSAKRRVHPGDSFDGPVHFTVGLKLQELAPQLAEIKKLSTKTSKSKTQDARMDHVGRSQQFAQEMATLATDTYGDGAVTKSLSGYFSMAFMTLAGWQSTLKLEEEGLKKQIPLALLKMFPSVVLKGIAADAVKKEQPDLLKWLQRNAELIKASAIRNLPHGDAGKKSLTKWMNWLIGDNDSAIDMLDEMMTFIPEKESLGSASATPYGHAAELRNINIGDQGSMGSVREAGIGVIRMSRGGGERVSEKDRSHSED
jgi:hypothetical protein